ncbi:MAG TPA: tetratricopeptide repeat protein [Gemmatimonadaceae bacterium]|nr:tetratricopeptide repeat protein [Gemmatimonadaceae bacterium]
MAAATRPMRTESETRSLDIEFYERRIAEDTLSAADRSRLASLYLQRARETGSYPDYERAAVLASASLALRESHNEATYVLLASALLAKHDFTEALRVARRLYAFDTTDASHTALLAEVELEVGDYSSAAQHFSAVSRSADNPSIAARLARWYEVTGRIDKARSILRQSAARLAGVNDVPREQLAWFHYRLGELLMRSGQLDYADSSFRRALVALPTDHRALGGLARLASARGDWNAVVEHGANAIAVQLDPATLGTMSDAYAALGDTAQARSFADAMAVSALGQPGAIHRAWGLFLLDHDRDIARVLREARREIAGRRDVYGYDLLAWAQYKSGRVADARRSAASALSQDTEDATLLYHAGMIALAAGDSVEARRRLVQSLRLNPGFSATQSPIARRTLQSLGATASAGAPGV